MSIQDPSWLPLITEGMQCKWATDSSQGELFGHFSLDSSVVNVAQASSQGCPGIAPTQIITCGGVGGKVVVAPASLQIKPKRLVATRRHTALCPAPLVDGNIILIFVAHTQKERSTQERGVRDHAPRAPRRVRSYRECVVQLSSATKTVAATPRREREAVAAAAAKRRLQRETCVLTESLHPYRIPLRERSKQPPRSANT